MRMTAVATIVMTLQLLLWGCASRHETSDFHAVDADGWRYGDTLHFDLSPAGSDTVATGHLAIALRHTAAYAYSNIWLETTVTTADGTVHRDTLNLPLADEFGNWYGRGSGLSHQVVDTIMRDIVLGCPPTVTLRHIMRNDLLPGIEQIGMIFHPEM